MEGTHPRPVHAGPECLCASERAVLDAIDLDWMLGAIRELVAIESWRGRERPAQEYMAALFEQLGMSLDVWGIDEADLRDHPDYATEIRRDDPLGVVARADFGDGDGPTLVLNGHVDVVPPGDYGKWTADPFRLDVRDGRAFGRGALDMKGPLLAGVAGVRAVLAAGPPLRGSLLIQSVIGEEDGGLGTLASVLRGHMGDAAIVLEPTRLRVAAVQAGALNFRLTVPGRAAHGALRHEGVSAIENFHRVYDDLIDFERERNAPPTHPALADHACPYAICVGTVRGGEWASSVLESIRAEGRFGVAVHEDVAAARQAFEDRVAARCARDAFLRDNPARVEWWGGQFAPCETDARARIVAVTRGAVRDLGLGDGEVVGVPYGSDLRLLVNAGGMPGVLFGPGDVAGAHREDESIGVTELLDGARAVALAVTRYLAA